jgi:V8-like Glu-specific endopeptidase
MDARGRGAHRALAGSLLSLATVLLLLAFGPSTAAVAGQASGIAVDGWSARQASGFWTSARMRQATPLDLRVRPRPTSLAGRPAIDAQRGTRHRIPPRAARAGASASSAADEVPDPTATGLRRNGVIFFEASGGFARCSGTSVNSPNLSVVFTAAHCINSGGPRGHWYRGRWVFVPGYRFGQRPFGVFPAKWLDTTHQWIATGSENVDVGAAVVTRNERGERLGDAVGGAGIAWGLKPNQVFDVHGYPAGPPFDGETQRLCTQTPFLGHDPGMFLYPGPLNLAVDCGVTGGSSGGGWTIEGGVLNSVTDYGYPDDSASDFGAYFGKEVARLYRRAAGIR